jgi:uncharacterized protein YukE
MDAAAVDCDRLGADIDDCYRRAMELRTRMHDVYQGAAAEAFDDFLYTEAGPVLEKTATMCDEIAAALRHTASEFDSADTTMAGVFRAV